MPEPPVVAKVALPPAVSEEMALMDSVACVCFSTTAAAIVVDAVAVAALNEVSAALVAVIEQVPADTAVNVLPETVQTEVVDET